MVDAGWNIERKCQRNLNQDTEIVMDKNNFKHRLQNDGHFASVWMFKQQF